MIHRIAWAVDAFEEAGELHKQTAQAISRLVAKTGALVEPVYVLTPGQLNMTLEFGGPWIEDYRPAAEKSLSRLLERLSMARTLPPKILTQDIGSTTQAAQVLTEYALHSQADLIITGTHGRSGVKRIFLGSFAEALLNQSTVPLMTVGPEETQAPAFDHILFPTEFGDHSKAIFRRVVELASELEASITLFHAVPHPIEPIIQSGAYLLGGAWVPVQAYFSDLSDRRKRRGDAWARWAAHRGVQVEVTVTIQPQQPVAEMILALAGKTRTSLIVMESRAGRIAATLVGSIARQIVRHAGCPVWIFGPHSRIPAKTSPSRAA